MSVVWEENALRRAGLSERQAEAMLKLSVMAEDAVAYPTKQALRKAWQHNGDEAPQLTAPTVLVTKSEVARYVELARNLGY